jgi:hypothetical protein
VGWPAGPAGVTTTTIGIDLTYHSLAHEGWILGLLHYPDELVAQHASEAGVPTDDLEIGVADANHGGPDARFPWRG